MHRKMMGIVLVLVMIFSISVPAFANGAIGENNVKITKDKATTIGKEIVKNYFATEIYDEKFQTRIELEKNWRNEDGKVWIIKWRKRKENGGVQFNVEIDANSGYLLSCTKDYYDERMKVPSMSAKEAEKKAEEFLKEIQPEKFENVKLKEDKNKSMSKYDIPNYRFEYIREINGVEFPSDCINIGIDGRDGQLIEYGINWHGNMDVPTIENIIDKKEARRLLEDKIIMEKLYIGIRNEETGKNNAIKLVYRPDYNGKQELNAKTKDFKEYKIDRKLESKDISFNRKEEIYKKSLNMERGKINKGKAEEITRDLLKELNEKDIEIGSIEYMENVDRYRQRGKNYWQVEFRDKDMKTYETEGEVTINADTGEVIEFYTYNDRRESKGSKPSLNWSEAYDKAIDALEKFYPDKIRNIDTKETYYERLDDEKEMNYHFNFSRKENGIEFNINSIDISINSNDGTIESLNMRWTDNLKFPNPMGKIGEEKAKELWLENLECKLIYSKDMDDKNNKLNLVYVLENKINKYGVSIDANRGTLLDYYGEKIKIDKKPNVDEEHPHGQELKVLEVKDIIHMDKIHLDKEITLIDAVKMLTKAKGYRSYRVHRYEDLKFTNISKEDQDYGILKGAIYFKILDNEAVEFNKEKKVNNMEMAKLMVKALGYEKLAKAQEIYILPFKDANEICEKDKGYAALCKGLGLIEGEEFNPQKNITYLDMAMIIYKSLEDFEE
ncbi:MAG: PepSY domain-containing protein [Anaeromicrobium sp.]|nr:PepSY domain-containing protein [Anaeromicrobium sp.]